MRKKFNRIFLDIDGVLANWTKMACSKLNVEYPVNSQFGSNKWLEKFAPRNVINNCANEVEFWENLEKYPWADRIVSAVKRSGVEWRFLTKPMKTASCFDGKARWIFKHYPTHWDKLWIVTGNKAWACRDENDLLIDDTQKNIDQWNEFGGTSFHWQEMTPDYDLWEDQCVALEKLLKN